MSSAQKALWIDLNGDWRTPSCGYSQFVQRDFDDHAWLNVTPARGRCREANTVDQFIRLDVERQWRYDGSESA